MNGRLALVTFAVFALLIPVVSAAEPSTSLRSFSDQACPTGSAKYAVDIHNPGSAADTYTVSTDVDWSSIAPSTVEVGPGETETVFLWLQPPATMEPGDYGFDVTVRSSNTGEEVTERGTLTVLSCRDVDLSVDQQEKTACRGETAEYAVEVTNAGEAEETYALSASAGAIEPQEVTLAPGESQTVTLSALSDREAEETIEVYAESTESYASADTAVVFRAERCKDVDLFLTPSEQNVCRGEAANYKITVRNTGSVQDSYELSTNVEGANVQDITLGPGEDRTFEMDVREDVGTHTVVARVLSKTLDIEPLRVSRDADLSVENCYDATIESQGDNQIQIGQQNRTLLQFNIINAGTRANNYTASFDGPDWTDIRPVEAELAPGEHVPVYLYVAPDYFSEQGTYTGKLVVEDQSGNVNRVVNVDITVGNETITAETDGEDRGLTGRLVSQRTGIVAILLVLALLFVGGYLFFQKRVQQLEEENAGQRRDAQRSADDYLDQNATTVISSLRQDSLGQDYLEMLYEEEQRGKNRKSVLEELERQLDRED